MATSRAKDLADFIAKQATDDDSILETGALQLPVGTTAERPTPVTGQIRHNTNINLAEYYDGTSWKAIDAPPTVSSVSPDNFDTAGDTITVTGSGFSSGATVKLVNNSGTEFVASTVTFTNSTTVSFDITQAMVDDDDDPYDVKVTNASGLSGTLADALDFAPEPVFATTAGTYNIFEVNRSSYSFDASATSTETDATMSYAVTTGSLPTGASINSSTGAITGFSAVGSDTSSTFTVTATATDSNSNTTTNTRSWTINVKAPVVTSYTSVGSGTFTVPSGLTSVDVLVVAGGGSGGRNHAGGGGAGGLIYRPAFPVTPGGSVSYTVGNGGTSAYDQGISHAGPQRGQNGQNSTFGGLTAIGGGNGGNKGDSGPDTLNAGLPGGSGGGSAGTDGSNPAQPAGTGTQPQQPGDSSTYGFGNPGGQGNEAPVTQAGGGGGGAGGQGYNGNNPSPGGGAGGVGKQYGISGSQVYYAGGGGGGTNSDGISQAAGGQGGGGKGETKNNTTQNPGTANRGGGGGGGYGNGLGGAPGGSGIVIVSY